MIFIDSRETRCDVPKLVENLGIPTSQVELEVGDYAVTGVCVERKSSEDYLASLTSGHLSDQLYAMSYNYPLSYLVVEGNMSAALQARGISRDIYISSLIGASYRKAPSGERGQIVTVNLDTPFDTALFLKKLHDKTLDHGPRLPGTKVKPTATNEMLVAIVSMISGVGQKKAEKLIKRFGNVRAIANATIAELQTVEGVGPKIANQVHTCLNAMYKEE